MIVKLLTEHHLECKLKRRLQRLARVCTCQNATLLEISCTDSALTQFLNFYRYLERLESEPPSPTHVNQPQKMDPSSLQKDGLAMRHRILRKPQIVPTKQQIYAKPANAYDYKTKQYGEQRNEKLYAKDLIPAYPTDVKKDVTLQKSRLKQKPNKSSFSRRNWTLRTYRRVVDALITGHVVYFTARTKRCKHVGTIPRGRLTTGDYVDVFEIGKDYNLKEPYSYVTFSSDKVVQSELGKYSVYKLQNKPRSDTHTHTY